MDEERVTSLQSAYEVLRRNSKPLRHTESLSVRSKIRRSTLQQLVNRYVKARSLPALESKLNRFYWQIRYGCQNPSCSTPTCLSSRRRVAKAPLRPFTVLSAKALAAFLVEQENPGHALCPHPPVPPDLCGLKCLYEAKSRRVETLPNGKIINRVDGAYLDQHEVKQIQDEKVFMDEASLIPNLSETRPRKDLKSISQNLFDTSAWWALQSISHEGGKFVWARLPSQVNGRTGDPTRVGNFKGNFEIPRPPAVTGPFNRLKEYYVLSHFDPANIRALVEILNHVDPKLAEQEGLMKELGTLRSLPNQTPLSAEARFWYRYAYQSMMHVFGNADSLFDSFHSPSADSETRRQLDCSEIEGCIRTLKSIEGSPQRIFPSLWVALGEVFASYDKLEPTRPYLNKDFQPQLLFKDQSDAIGDKAAAHIIGITVAALNASIPVSGTSYHDFNKFRTYSQFGYSVSHFKAFLEHSQQTNRAFVHLQDAFNDDQAMNLATRMVRVWMTRRALEVSKDQKASFTIAVMKKIESPSRPEKSSIDSHSFVRSESVGGYEKNLPSLLLIEWLRRVIFRYWDGKAEIDQMSPVAGAIDWLGVLCRLTHDS